MTPSLGAVAIDLARLVETRALVQANSGGGKSWCLRRLLEQTAGQVQQLVIDPEGEFSTLRERFDYIVCAPQGGDAVANPSTAAALARALWKAGASAILDVYELKAHERVLFVRRFLEALVNMPRAHWHPTIVVIDEAHVFAPQVGSAESLGAVVDLATRGRKRGLALVAATQRLSKLHKDVAAELLNKLIGRTGLDLDVRRAADELGLSARDSIEMLRNLEPGEFFVFGPAFSRTVVRERIGDVQTTHPRTGHRQLVAPPPSKTVLAALARLEGIQRDVEAEAKTNEALVAEVTALRRKVAAFERTSAAAAARPPDVVAVEPVWPVAETMAIVDKAIGLLQGIASLQPGQRRSASARRLRAVVRQSFGSGRELVDVNVNGTAHATFDGQFRAGAVRILRELAARAPAGYSRAQVGGLTQFAHRGGTFTTYLGDLRRAGCVEERGGMVYATTVGIAHLGSDLPAAPTTHDEAMQLWRKALRSGAYGMLETVVAAGRDGITRDGLAQSVGMVATGGTFTTYLGDLRRNGLVTESGRRCTANDILFPKG